MTTKTSVSNDLVSEAGHNQILKTAVQLVTALVTHEAKQAPAAASVSQVIAGSHNLEHMLTVLNNARCALDEEKVHKLSPSQRLAVLLAALMHEIDDPKIFPKSVDYANARALLTQLHSQYGGGTGTSKDLIINVDLVVRMISLVSSSKNGDSVPDDVKQAGEWMLYPRRADRMEAEGVPGIVRCYQFTVETKAPLFLPTTARAKDEKDLWTRIATPARYAAYKGKSVSMIDHYYDKLLRLSDQIVTDNPFFRRELEKRRRPLVDFVLEFGRTGRVDIPSSNSSVSHDIPSSMVGANSSVSHDIPSSVVGANSSVSH